MAGISSLDVSDEGSLATIYAALEAGINHFDTAYSYGYFGEADLLLRRAFESYFAKPMAQIDFEGHGIVYRNQSGVALTIRLAKGSWIVAPIG